MSVDSSRLGPDPQAPVPHAPTSGGDFSTVGPIQAADPTKGPDGIGSGKPQAGQPLLQSSIPAAPSLSLPKGGGAIKGIGEKFDVNASTGTGSTSFPIQVSGARGGMNPQLALAYNSGAGNGEFGLGWGLSGTGSVTRKTARGLPKYNDFGSDFDSDVYLLMGAEDLVPSWKLSATGEVVYNADQTPMIQEAPIGGYLVRQYIPRVVQSFARIERWTNLADAQDVHWRTITPQNQTAIFGNDDSSRICEVDPINGARKIFSWLIAESYDARGNAILYKYKAEDSKNVALNQAHEAYRPESSRNKNRYLKYIHYGNTAPNRKADDWSPFSASQLPDSAWKFSVVFDYGEHDSETPTLAETLPWPCRMDPFSRHLPGFEVRTYRLCRRILMFHHFAELGKQDFLVTSTDLGYKENSTLTYLTSATKVGYNAAPTSSSPYSSKSLPPLTFEYSAFPSDDDLQSIVAQGLEPADLESLPIGADGTSYRWVDLDGEGLPGILTEQGGRWYYKRNQSANNQLAGTPSVDSDSQSSYHPAAKFGPLEIEPSRPSLALNEEARFADITGTGNLDLVQISSSHWGYYERDGTKQAWNDPITFLTYPNVNTRDRQVAFVDLTGDGLADILIYGDQLYCWYNSLGSDGYGAGSMITQPNDPRMGPVWIAGDTEQTIYLADMSGDGLMDIVRVVNGDVCYWPNYGYGQFGSVVRMDNAPFFDADPSFNHNRVRLADVDGSGTTDIIYVGATTSYLYLNQSGNSFSDPKSINTPPMDDIATLDMVDLLGTGTVCLVWSSSLPGASNTPLQYLDLLHGQKPHLLTGMINSLGSETRIQYAPSTKYYLDDLQKGNRWITRLPFPVHCVQKKQVIDRITENRYAVEYSYSNGYFDGIEREFRGFSRSESWDSGIISFSNASNSDDLWHTVPLYTKTWTHTGFFFDRERITHYLAHEYYGAPARDDESAMQAFYATLLPENVLPDVALEPDAVREACRALNGTVLRTETYGLDESAKASIPYSVQETSVAVRCVQAVQDAHAHSVYTVQPRESLTYKTERNPDDALQTHALTLEVDAFNNVLRSIKVSYGRKPANIPSSGPDLSKQQTTMVAYTTSQVTELLNLENDYYTPVSYHAQLYEITGLGPKDPSTRFTLADFDAIDSLPIIPFDQQPTIDSAQKRLLKRSMNIFRKDDLTGLLDPGQVQLLALPGASYDMCYTGDMISQTFKRQTPGQAAETLITDPSDIMQKQGGFISLDSSGSWWKTEGQISYHRSPSASPADELAMAKKNFFLPLAFTDPWGNRNVVTYDSYVLFLTSIQDPVGNVSSSVQDYRVLAPKSIIDQNGNQAAVAFDALGMAAGTALMGNGSGEGDSLDSFSPDLSINDINQFFQSPTENARKLLGTATSRYVNVYDRYYKSGDTAMPCYSATISRTERNSQPPAAGAPSVLISFAYSDGSSQIIQETAVAKPGPVGQNAQVVPNRWIRSGWVVFNDKGKPVRMYDPFFDDTHDFKKASIMGTSSILVYDPLLRLIAKIYSDHTFEKVVFTPWGNIEYDSCDNIFVTNPSSDLDVGLYIAPIPPDQYLPSWYDAHSSNMASPGDRDAATKSLALANTPHVDYFDAIGNRIAGIDDNGTQGTSVVSYSFDIQGNQLQIVDALGRMVIKCDYSMSGEVIHSGSMEFGEKWTLTDVTGHDFLRWNDKGLRFRTEYDSARRPAASHILGLHAGEVLVQTMEYGENAPNAAAHNLRGKVYKLCDQAGQLISNDFDFQNNLLSSTRTLAKNYKEVLDWSQAVDLDESLAYTATASYDVLNRPVLAIAPDKSTTYRSYNAGGYLDTIFANVRGENLSQDPLTWTAIVQNVDRDAKNQIQRIAYGNGVVTEHEHYDLTYRLKRLRTRASSGKVIQDLQYSYDAMGNVTLISDQAQQSIFFRNSVVKPGFDYTYDALYRLIRATGREHLGQTKGVISSPSPTGPFTGVDVESPGDGKVMTNYEELYQYDAAGNILSLRHNVTDPNYSGWQRLYKYQESSQMEPSKYSNRLTTTSVGSNSETYTYDGPDGMIGDITSMPHLAVMQWNYLDNLQASSQQRVGPGAVPEMTYYVYDSTGKRVRKVTERQASGNAAAQPTRLRETIYLGGVEITRTYAGDGITTTLERTTLEINGGSGVVARIELRTVGQDGGAARLTRFQLDNHQGSATVELDDQGQLITYEEYFPYGTSSYQAVASQTQTPKRYRYSGKERDEESGLYYYGARYYAPWLGRWTSCDPSGFKDGLNVYAYCSNSPAQYVDADGRFKVNGDEVGEGLKTAAIGLAFGLIVGAAFLSGIGEAALLVGASEVAVTSALEYAGAAGVGLGIASLFKSGMDIGTGEDVFTGKKLDDNERSRRLGSFALELPATILGVAGIAGPRPPTGTLSLEMPGFRNPFAKTPEGFLMPAPASATATAPATTLIGVTAPVAAGGGGSMGIMMMASHGGGGGGSSGGGGGSSNNNAGSGGSATKKGSPSNEGEQQPFKLPPKSEEDKAFLVKPQELLLATDAEVMKYGSDPKYLEEMGVGSWQIEQMQKGGPEWLMRMVKGSANESAFKLKLLDDPTLGPRFIDTANKQPGVFNIPGLGGRPDLGFKSLTSDLLYPMDVTTPGGVRLHDLRPNWQGNVDYFTYPPLALPGFKVTF